MNTELHDFIRSKIAALELAIKARNESEKTWRGGTEVSWKAVGCSLTRSKRLEQAASEERILLKLMREQEMFLKVLEELPEPGART